MNNYVYFEKQFFLFFNRAHEQYGYCQAGTSGVLEPQEDYVAIGTPGPYTWRGAIYVITASDDFIHKDTVVYSSPMPDNGGTPLVSKYSYLGKAFRLEFEKLI